MIKIPKHAVAIDTECTGLNPYLTRLRKQQRLESDTPFAISVCHTNLKTDFFRGHVDPKTRNVGWDRNDPNFVAIKDLCEDPSSVIVFHNAPFDISMLRRIDIQVRAKIVHDTLVMAHIANPTELVFGLKYLGARYLQISTEDEENLLIDVRQARRIAKSKGWKIAIPETHGRKPAAADMWLAKPELLERYSRQDVVRTMQLFLMYRDILNENELGGGRLNEIYKTEMKLMRVLLRMRRYGMTYLPRNAKKLKTFYSGYMNDQNKIMAKLGHPDLNCQSHKQLKEIFIVGKEYSTSAITHAGDHKIDAEQLMYWARGSSQGADVDGDGEDGDRLARAILEWKAGKKVTEYLEAYDYFQCDRIDGSAVLHPFYRQAGPVTGRMSCSDPNLQQVASAETSRRHSQIRARQRECFGPRPGHIWYMPDYSQIEVWIFAFQSGDSVMCEALLGGHDFHLSTAKAAWGDRKDFEQYKKWWRQRAKMILFAKFYGGGIDKIAFLIRCMRSEASQFVQDFDQRLPGIPRYMKRLTNKVRREGILVNLFGREYPINPDLAYRAVNYMIQGTAAEVMKRAMIRIDKIHKNLRLMGTLHDEVFLELPNRLHSKSLMIEIQSAAQEDSANCGLPVPFPIGFKMTKTNWSEAEEVEL